MTTLGLVRDRRTPALTSLFAIEYTSSEHRGIIMYSELHEAISAADALGHAEHRLSDIKSKYGARGYRVVDADGCSHAMKASSLDE